MAPVFRVLTAAVALWLLVGCTKTYWDPGWIFDGLEEETFTQTLAVESDPPADLWVDGAYVGRTPVSVSLPYAVNRVRLLKRRYKEPPGGEKEILEEKRRTEAMDEETGHTLHFKAENHHDRFLPVAVPHPGETIQVALKPKPAGGRFEITPTLRFTADRRDWAFLDPILDGYGTGDGPRKVRAAGPERWEKSFRATLSDAAGLDSLLGQLHTAARNRNRTFNVRDLEITGAFSTNPTREFRAVWVAYLDWPRGEADPAAQRAAFTGMLDRFRDLNINVVLFQVRMEADALYDSRLAPWSRLLTGVSGKDPGYDPLAFAVREAHERGMELHAWLNPYRTRLSARCGSGSAGMAGGHISRTHPDWVLRFRLSGDGRCCCYWMLDPGIPRVTDHIADVVSEIVRGYDVDGIHFDDMFYPYPQAPFRGAGAEDLATFRRYRRGPVSLADWRRENVNGMIDTVHQRIKAIAPHVRFGVSPFGIWRSGHPPGTRGMSAYDDIYGDALAWLQRGDVDYLSPQLYWKLGGNPDYGALLRWWAEQGRRTGRHIYPGQILYHLRPWEGETGANTPDSPDDILAQIDENRANRDEALLGGVFYRAVNRDDHLLAPAAFKERLASGLYATPALPPVMPWLSNLRPGAPENLRWETGENGDRLLRWDPAEGRGIWKYAVYMAFREDLVENGRIEAVGRLIGVTGGTAFRIDGSITLSPGDLLYVAAVSRNNVESAPSDPVAVPGQRDHFGQQGG